MSRNSNYTQYQLRQPKIKKILIYLTQLQFTKKQDTKSMDQDLKKKIIIGVSIGAAIVAGLFIKNKIEETRFKPLSKETVLQILKRARKENFATFKQVAMMATQMAAQMKLPQMDPQMVKGYLDAPDSPLKMSQIFQNNYSKACESANATYAQFNESVEHYIKIQDAEVKHLVQECERDYELSLQGKLPEVKVTVPASLTKERLLEVQKKLTLKRYLLQVDMFRKLRGKSQQELMTDPELMKSLSNPEIEQQKILQEEGLGQNDQPAAAVFASAVTKLRNDTDFKQSLTRIETHYAKIFNKYKLKLQQNKISENELNELEDELIYTSI